MGQNSTLAESTAAILTGMNEVPQKNTRALIEASKAEAAELLRIVAPAQKPGETVKEHIARTAIMLGWTFGRTEDIWRNAAKRIHVHEMDQLRALKPLKSKPDRGTRIRDRSSGAESWGRKKGNSRNNSH